MGESQLILQILCSIQSLLEYIRNYWDWQVAVFYTAVENHGEDKSFSTPGFTKCTLPLSLTRCKNKADKMRPRKKNKTKKQVTNQKSKQKTPKSHSFKREWGKKRYKRTKKCVIVSVKQIHFHFSHLKKYILVKQIGCKGFPVFLAPRVKRLKNLYF